MKLFLQGWDKVLLQDVNILNIQITCEYWAAERTISAHVLCAHSFTIRLFFYRLQKEGAWLHRELDASIIHIDPAHCGRLGHRVGQSYD